MKMKSDSLIKVEAFCNKMQAGKWFSVFLGGGKVAQEFMRRTVVIALIALAMLLSSPGFSATDAISKARPAGAAATLGKLTVIRSNIDLLDQLRRQGVEADRDGALAKSLLSDAASLTNGRVTSLETLRAATGTAPTPYERLQGWLTFSHVMLLLGASMMVLALAYLFGIYFLALLILVPARVWEVVVYLVCFGAICAGHSMSDEFTIAPVLPGCLGLLGCFFFSASLHHFKPKGWMAWLFVPVWGAAALFYHNEMLGFLTVLAALNGMGFFAGMTPGLVVFGFSDSAIIPRTTLAAGLLLSVHVALHCLGADPAWLAPFRYGMGFMGSFVYLLGLLIMANRYYMRYLVKEYFLSGYIAMQVVSVVSLAATLYFGSVYRMDSLLRVSGPFLCLFVMEKYMELPWRRIGWAWGLLGMGGLLYGVALFAQARPEWFLFMR